MKRQLSEGSKFKFNVEAQDVYYQPCFQANINTGITNSAKLDNIVGAVNTIERANYIPFRFFTIKNRK